MIKSGIIAWAAITTMPAVEPNTEPMQAVMMHYESQQACETAIADTLKFVTALQLERPDMHCAPVQEGKDGEPATLVATPESEIDLSY